MHYPKTQGIMNILPKVVYGDKHATPEDRMCADYSRRIPMSVRLPGMGGHGKNRAAEKYSLQRNHGGQHQRPHGEEGSQG